MDKDKNTPDLKLVEKNTKIENNEEIEEVSPEETSVYEMKTFIDQDERTIIGKYPIEDQEFPEFVGVFAVQTNMGPIQLKMQFAKNLTIKECFDHFDELAEETVKLAQEEASNQSRIVTPGSPDKSGIITP